MDVKARSRAMREILIRLVERARGSIEVKVFGDKVILDEGTYVVFCSDVTACLIYPQHSRGELAPLRHPHLFLFNRLPA